MSGWVCIAVKLVLRRYPI